MNRQSPGDASRWAEAPLARMRRDGAKPIGAIGGPLADARARRGLLLALAIAPMVYLVYMSLHRQNLFQTSRRGGSASTTTGICSAGDFRGRRRSAIFS